MTEPDTGHALPDDVIIRIRRIVQEQAARRPLTADEARAVARTLTAPGEPPCNTPTTTT